MKRSPLKRSRPKPIDRLCRQVVRAELGPQCLLCPRDGTEIHHMLPRSLWPQRAVKYEPDFQVPLCHWCHAEVEAEAEAGYSRLLQALAVVDVDRFLALVNYQSARPVLDFAPVTVSEQERYLRWRLLHALQRRAYSDERNLVPAWKGAY